MKKLLPRFRAFTLIELLIVITIIGILAVALIPRLTGGPGRARDAQRKADLQQIATALEFYADDNGEYPASGGCIDGADGENIKPYMTTIPSDPGGLGWSKGLCTNTSTPGKNYTYVALDNGKGYLLVANLETETERDQGVYDTGFVKTTGTGSTAAANFEANTACSDSTCSSTDVIYVIGR